VIRSGESHARLVQRRSRISTRRRAAVVVQVTVTTTLMLGMAALAVDVGLMYTAQSQVQLSADAAALAAAAELSKPGDVEAAALAKADEYAGLNKVMGMTPKVWPEDMEFGDAAYDEGTGKFEFQPGDDTPDAVRVTVQHRLTADPDERASLSLPLAFANVFGIGDTQLRARASALLVPRDIAVVIDLSNSMCWDSELRFWNRTDGGYSNLRDIWCALNGPAPSKPYLPTCPEESEYADDTGPSFGWLTNWGNQLVSGYSASSDPGLWYIRKSYTTSVAAIDTKLTTAGYNSAERTALKSGTKDGTTSHWRNRCGVLLGLATWKSGKSNPAYPGGGDGDDYVEDSEVTWVANPSFAMDWNWKTYIDWVQNHYNSDFKRRYGLKTLSDFILDDQPEYASTNVLWNTPEEPLRAIKDAVQTMTDVIIAQDGLDQMSLEIFATTGRHELNLTSDYQTIPDRLYARQSGHYDRTTNIGGGLQKAITELSSARARQASKKYIVLMSDGQPNIDQYGNYVGDGAEAAVSYATNKATEAANIGCRIYTVSVGFYADRSLMQQIAEIGHGEEFAAIGNPAEYSAQLQEIFQQLGGKRPVQLID
jgi:hypothetical protein